MVIDPDRLNKYANTVGKELKTNNGFVDDQALKQLVYDDLCSLAIANKFNSLEKPKQITLLIEPFSQDNDILTPTMKIKRNIA